MWARLDKQCCIPTVLPVTPSSTPGLHFHVSAIIFFWHHIWRVRRKDPLQDDKYKIKHQQLDDKKNASIIDQVLELFYGLWSW
jgi:hypothetical protein